MNISPHNDRFDGMTANMSEERRNGIRVLRISSPAVEAEVVPALGAKISKLRNTRSGREWCWHPGPSPVLFANHPGDSFEKGPHVGIDECFPTVAACTFGGRMLPCHGAVWSRPWEVDEAAWSRGSIVTTIYEPPFHLCRTLNLAGSTVAISYELTNQSSVQQPYLWAFHPLFRTDCKDRIILPDAVNSVCVEAATGLPGLPKGHFIPWPNPFPGFCLDKMVLGGYQASCVKLFTGKLSEGFAVIDNEEPGGRLEMRWDTQANPHLGIWICRGGYRGICDAIALEPTNALTDSLLHAQPLQAPVTLEPREARRWELSLTLA